MKRKWTPYPANIWDVEAVERWLEDEAARGWRLDGSRQWGGGLVRLLRTEPAVCRVRVQPVGFVSQEAWQERLETFRELGWTFGATFDWHFHMAAFYCDDPAVPELDTDMEVWAMVWRKAFVWGLWESVGLGALGLALLASMVLLGWEFTVTEPLGLLAIQVLGGAVGAEAPAAAAAGVGGPSGTARRKLAAGRPVGAGVRRRTGPERTADQSGQSVPSGGEVGHVGNAACADSPGCGW